MKHAFYRLLFAILCLGGLVRPAVSDCRANDCCPNGFCDWCCNFHLIDCYTKYAWRRTWWGPNALATPLRDYYIPRPPAGCWDGHLCSGCRYSADEAYAMIDTNRCEHCYPAMGPDVSPEAAVGFSPESARLGQIRNELDVLGAVGTPGRPPAPKH